MKILECLPHNMRAPDLAVQHRCITIDGARLFYREAGSTDLPRAELHLLDGGDGALETNLAEIVTLGATILRTRSQEVRRLRLLKSHGATGGSN